MTFHNFITSIVIKIAQKLGLKINEKPLITDDYNNTSSISLTATIANRVATLTVMDSSIDIIGDSVRASYLKKFVNDTIIDKIAIAAEVSLGVGDVLLKPYTDGERIGIDIIPNENFYICECCGDFIKSCIIKCEEIHKRNGSVFERYETQRLKTVTLENGTKLSAVFIYQTAYINGVEHPLADIPEWAEIPPETVIPNVEHLIFGRIKCPTINRDNVNGVNGVPITYGLDSVMQNAVKAYNRFNDEYERKESFVFADKTLFKKDKDNNTIIPNGKNRIFMLLPHAANGEGTDNLIREYSPDIRDDSLIAGIEQNFKMLEMMAGLSSGILSQPTTNYATATEMKASLQLTFAYITRFRRSITQCVYSLINSIDILLNTMESVPIGDFKVSVDWSSAYIENLTEQYTRLIQAEAIGAVSKAEVRAWLLDETLDVASAKVEEIQKNSKNDLTNSS